MSETVDLSEFFRLAGKRVTRQRAVIAAAVENADGHRSAEDIYTITAPQLPGLSLKTVYQTLNELVALGALTQLDLGTASARFDLRTDSHHHVVCDICERVEDVSFDISKLELPSEIAKRFEATSTEVVVRGRCVHHDN